MAASVLHLLETLETRLEQNKAELIALREENQQLKQQLAALSTRPPGGATASPAEHESDVAAAEEAPNEAPEHVSAAVSEPVTPEAVTQPSPQALLKQWYQRYPHAFFKGHTKPLKVGIHQDLAEREPWPSKLIRRALANYVNLPRYIKSMREGAERVDLDGQPAGKVDKEAAKHASERRQEAPTKKRMERPAPPAKSRTNKAQPAASNSSPNDEKLPSRTPVPEKSEQKKPLTMEEKLKGLQQKFEGR
ncbi:MAG: ProQ/FINO family protein [Pseudomonadota bacterium]|nr:ABC transporter substrate-binding protein [Halomonas sp.]MEC9019758.1 ProQ/FINO family protein [Pseudomonadota bacterium]MED5557322.1 ProQ/FINO family protein [Pseudomonadota bacterium]MEE3269467.1 ProQ/FINO family protein [Pseudomonadota bacterium]